MLNYGGNKKNIIKTKKPMNNSSAFFKIKTFFMQNDIRTLHHLCNQIWLDL